MNRLSIEKRAQILRCLVEGNSIRSTVRMTGASKNTISKLLNDVGAACEAYQDEAIKNLDKCVRIQCDEIWSFCYAKAKNVPAEHKGEEGYGDVWTWTALCADTKLMITWAVGNRGHETADAFMYDLSTRLNKRPQITTDGHGPYIDAVEKAFGSDVDYAMQIKSYGEDKGQTEKKYSPGKVVGTIRRVINGAPDPKHISTSYVERQNLTIRMSNRRFTRLTNAFSKKLDNHKAAIALNFMHYNFCRIHQTLCCTPAMEAGVTDRLWEMEDLAALVD